MDFKALLQDITQNHTDIDTLFRRYALLVDAMLEVCTELGVSRETLAKIQVAGISYKGPLAMGEKR